MAPVLDILDQLRAHVEEADAKHDPYNSAHEAYGVLMEEVRELEEHIFTCQKNRDVAAMRKEAIDVAVVMIRFIHGVCDGGKARV